jgi:uncharacterized protein
MNPKSDINRIVDYFERKAEISALYIFGSAAKGRETAESDIDIAVLINDQKKGRRTYETLKKIYYAASPKLSSQPVQIVILNMAPPFLKYRIIKTGKVLFDKNRRLRVRLTANTIMEYFDYKPIEDIFLKAVAGRFMRATIGR